MRYIDPLTRLTNREYFYSKAFTVLKSKFNRDNTHSILYLIDIVNFRQINTLYGYADADEVLKEVAVRLLDGIEMIRGDVSLSRTGSNEFALLVGSLNMNADEMPSYTKYLIDMIQKKFEAPIEIGEKQCSIKVNIGATYFLAKEKDIESMIQEASVALQDAKVHIDKSYSIYLPKMTEVVEFQNDLRQAFETEIDRRVVLQYQPVVDIHCKPAGYEVLPQWHKVNQEILEVEEFLPYLRESGYIVAFDQYVFEKTCQQLAEWEEKCEESMVEFISLNISAKSFMSSEFLLFVPKTIEKYGVDPKHIIFEINENEFLSDLEAVGKKMELLRDYGIGFSLDSYGVDYASLSPLYKLPFSGLKIDKSLIATIDTDKKNRKIVSLILMMAEAIDLKVIAEGVDRESQREILLSMECDYFQGPLIDASSSLEQAFC